jgi:hypothetical protein
VTVVGRVLGLLCGFVAAIFLLTLALINRQTVALILDPFTPNDPVISLALPFYAYLFAMLIVGVIAGGTATWLSQGKWRRIARNRTHEALRWKAEAERLSRERDAAASRRHLAIAGR